MVAATAAERAAAAAAAAAAATFLSARIQDLTCASESLPPPALTDGSRWLDLMEHTAAGAAAFTSEASSHPSVGDLQKNRPLVGIGDIGENLRQSRLVWCASRGVVCVQHGGPLPAWNHRVEADQQAVDDQLGDFQCPECDHDGCDDVSHPEVDALAMTAHRDPNTVISRNHPAQRLLIVQDGIHLTFVIMLQLPWHGARADHELLCWAQVALRPKLGVIGVGILYVDV
eukprot:CAMPEP_0203938732 /NCGR_PEP_ID=MMETSP0359-20131031/75679_1 /ASSEMBLY_ACC=CAM_ASM_000338 /TAXON_ID=268821 /ORGANISM="Scrippsiella Hangoei, Strain SHTV-5" /LENGTH=228 /DNA_ID=CAMNT_0050868969 /DNA_START=166 /DNA_END=851 /DNA_ORIENTATION=+